jgi:hypothetical protein
MNRSIEAKSRPDGRKAPKMDCKHPCVRRKMKIFAQDGQVSIFRLESRINRAQDSQNEILNIRAPSGPDLLNGDTGT